MLHINVNEDLAYSPETGEFIWLTNRGNRAAGSAAGYTRPDGYVSIFVFGKRQYAHRLAFKAMTGKFPEFVVDHINGNKSDNRWSNLRDVTQSRNMSNRHGPQKNSKTGLLGASPHARSGKFIAQIRRGEKLVYLGIYETAELAHAAYIKAKNELFTSHQR